MTILSFQPKSKPIHSIGVLDKIVWLMKLTHILNSRTIDLLDACYFNKGTVQEARSKNLDYVMQQLWDLTRDARLASDVIGARALADAARQERLPGPPSRQQSRRKDLLNTSARMIRTGGNWS